MAGSTRAWIRDWRKYSSSTHGTDHGVKRVYSVDLADNDALRHLAADLGITVTPDPDDRHQVIYSLSIDDDKPVAA